MLGKVVVKMNIMTIEMVKEVLGESLEGYEVKERRFAEGDLGALAQIEFNSSAKGGNIDIWSLGWFGVFVYDYMNEEILLNVLLDPTGDRKPLLKQLKALL